MMDTAEDKFPKLEPDQVNKTVKMEHFFNIVNVLSTTNSAPLPKEEEDKVVSGLQEINEALDVSCAG